MTERYYVVKAENGYYVNVECEGVTRDVIFQDECDLHEFVTKTLMAELEDGYNRYKAAIFRHLMEFEKGNVIDDESGREHLAHMAWNAIAMLQFAETKQKENQDIQERINKGSCIIHVEDVEPKVEYVIYPNIGQNVEFSYNYECGVFNSVGTIEKYVLDKNGETFYVREESERGRGFTYMLKREEIIKPI